MKNTEDMPKAKRDIRLDVLKTIGIILIILAHTNPPIWIHQIRNFDVPLMVLLSGTLFYSSSSKSQDYSFWKYWKI
ncbi:MAG: hypothetical protein SVX43_06045 [Cyanobacteriota bacterium]|nr:hypothetical protein [Cyanobacteriota bacterium]